MNFFFGFSDELIKHSEFDPYDMTVKGGITGLSLGTILGAILGARAGRPRFTNALTGAAIGAIPGFAAGKYIGSAGDLVRSSGRIIDSWKEL